MSEEATRILGAALVVLGLVSLVECFGRFAIVGRGTPAPVAPTRDLVVSGQYRYVRNPMYLAVVAIILGQAFLLGATGASGAESLPMVRVGLDPRSAPWAFVPGYDYEKEDVRAAPKLTGDQISRLEGLDVDVLRSLEGRMGVRAQVVQTPWLDLEPGLLAGRYDLILNAWTPNAKTPVGIAASDPYYEWGLLIASRAADRSIRSVADLAERSIGHVSDPSVLPALRALGAGLGARLTVVDQGGEELFKRLDRHEIDAIVFDSAFVRWRVARDGAFRVVGEPLNHLGYHVGVRASDKALFEKVQAAVKELVGSPEAQEIRRRWESAGTPAP